MTDYTGTLSEDRLSEIQNALENVSLANGLQGHVVINSNTGEWYLDEYVKDYGDFLKMKGKLESTGWLLYISLDDKKFGFAVQSGAAKSINSNRVRDLSFMLSDYLGKGDLAGGIIAVTNAIGELSAPKTVSEKKKMDPNLLIFMGILLITAVLMYRLRRYKKEPAQAKGRSV
ncbi:MAG: TPM domain-containing protein [bacterium]